MHEGEKVMTKKNLTILAVAILTVLAVFYFVSQTVVQHMYGEMAEQTLSAESFDGGSDAINVTNFTFVDKNV